MGKRHQRQFENLISGAKAFTDIASAIQKGRQEQTASDLKAKEEKELKERLSEEKKFKRSEFIAREGISPEVADIGEKSYQRRKIEKAVGGSYPERETPEEKGARATFEERLARLREKSKPTPKPKPEKKETTKDFLSDAIEDALTETPKIGKKTEEEARARARARRNLGYK